MQGSQVQALCYYGAGAGFTTCWRPGSIATRMVEILYSWEQAPFTPIRFSR